MEEIIIRIGKGGKINLSVDGVKGPSCKEITKNLEKALGSTVETKNTGEYFEQKQENTNMQNLGGGSSY